MATPSVANQRAIKDYEEACRELFGAHPEDVLIPIKTAEDALGWLEEILNTIVRIAVESRAPCSPRIQALAEAGRYLAMDMGNFVGCEYELKHGRLIAKGVASTGASEVQS